MDRTDTEQNREIPSPDAPAEEMTEQGQNASDEPKRRGTGVGFLLGAGTMLLLALAVVGTLLGTGVIAVGKQGQTEFANNVMTDAVTKKLNNLIGDIGQYYYEDVDAEDLINGIYKGLFAGLNDPYSAYYTPREYEDIMISANANYYGIGAALQQDRNTMEVTVSRVYDDSGAASAGLKNGDQILAVEDIEVSSMELSDLAAKIRGEKGTSVHLTVRREGEEEPLQFDVVRGEVSIPTVEYKLLDSDVGYIQISEFANNTPKAFSAAVEDLKARGMQYMIVDLRGNVGGVLTACQKMLDMILPKGVVVYTEDKYGKRENYTSDAKHYMDIPLAVLVNENTASASEIFAGAIRDFEYGTLIGTKTFGKGIVQSICPLPDGSAYKLTISRYFTPKGENIHGTGIEPDIELEYKYLGDAKSEYDEMQDNQIQKAIEVLKEAEE